MIASRLRIRTRIRTLAAATLAALALSALAVLSPVAPSASAHEAILSTTPAAGEHLTDPPREVAMVFTDKLIEVGAIILVVDEQGTNWVDGDVRLDGATAAAPLKANLPDGNYQVRWRVVSSDGHPISGTFDFSTGTARPTADTAPARDQDSSTSTPQPRVDAADASDSGEGLPLIAVGAIGAAIGLVLLAVVMTLLPRKRRS